MLAECRARGEVPWEVQYTAIVYHTTTVPLQYVNLYYLVKRGLCN